MTGEPGYTRMQKAVYIVGLLGLAAQYVLVLLRPAKYQWDFRAYYYAAQLLIDGQNPYDFDALIQLGTASGAHDDNLHAFIYPVHALLWFLPLSELSYHGAYYVYLTLKLTAMVVFLIVAKNWIKRGWWGACTPLFAVLLFGGAIPSDLRTGNVALFEATVVLFGFVLLQRQRLARSTLCIVLASSFKTALAPLMIAPLVTRAHKRWLATISAVSALPLLFLISWLVAPELSRNFLQASGGLIEGLNPRGERGALNASAPRVFADLYYLISANSNLVVIGVCYILWVLVVLASAVHTWRRFDLAHDQSLALMYLLLTYGLLVPRLTQYSYILMIIPCLFALHRARPTLRWAIVGFACIPFFNIRRDLLGIDPLSPATSFALLPLEYSNFVVLIACWCLLTFTSRREPKTEPTPGSMAQLTQAS